MTNIEFGRWRLSIDPDATRHAYAHIEQGAAKTCGCCYCRNFIATRVEVYPQDALRLFDHLGIETCKEAKTYHLTRLESGLHLYGGFFHFVGRIDAGRDAIQPSGTVELEPVTDKFSLGFTAQVSLRPAAFAEMPVAQLEILTHVPWRLADHPEPT